MVKPELGTKRTCPNCAVRFYDLLKTPCTCPKCNTSFLATSILPSKAEFPGNIPQPAPKEKPEAEDEETGEVELISLEDAEAEEKADDDETAGIEDVDLGEDADTAEDDEDDTFLVEEEEDANSVDDLIEGGKEDDEET